MASWWKRRAQPRRTSDDGALSAAEIAEWIVRDEGWWGGPAETAIQLLCRMAELPPSRAQIIPFRHPRILRPDAVEETLAALGGEQVRVRAQGRQLALYSQRAFNATLEWPTGLGPIDVLLGRVTRGMLTIEQALIWAREIGARGDVIVPYALTLGQMATLAAREGDRESGLLISRLLLAAADAWSGDEGPALKGWTAWRWSAGAFLEVATWSLSHMPDGRLFADAQGVADRIRIWGTVHGPAEHASALVSLGRLFLEPYTAEFNLEDAGSYWNALEQWHNRGQRQRDPTVDDNPAMPEPLIALRSARAAFEQAHELNAEPSAASWKALIQTLFALTTLDPNPPDFDLVAVAERALTHLDPINDAQQRPFVELILSRARKMAGLSGQVVQSAQSGQTAEPGDGAISITTLAQQVGANLAISTGLVQLQRELDEEGSRSDDMLEQLWALAIAADDETLRREVLAAHVVRLNRVVPEKLLTGTGPFPRRLAQLNRMIADWSPDQQSAALLGLAASSTTTDDEASALPLLTLAADLSPRSGLARTAAIAYMRATLMYGEACNLGAAGKAGPAIKAYLAAAIAYLACDLTDEALHCLERVERDAFIDSDTALATILGLGSSALPLELALGTAATSLIALSLRTSSSQLVERCPQPIPIVRDQIAKGLRLGVAVSTPHPILLDDISRARLEEIRVAAAQTDPTAAGVAASALDDEAMLASFVAPEEATPGRTDAEILINLQRSFDEHLSTSRYPAAGHPNWLTLDEVQSLLGHRTVLISLFLGAAPDGRFAVHVAAVTFNSIEGSLIPLELPSMLMVLRDVVTLTQSPVGVLVSELRRQIVQDPMFDAVSPEASANSVGRAANVARQPRRPAAAVARRRVRSSRDLAARAAAFLALAAVLRAGFEAAAGQRLDRHRPAHPRCPRSPSTGAG